MSHQYRRFHAQALFSRISLILLKKFSLHSIKSALSYRIDSLAFFLKRKPNFFISLPNHVLSYGKLKSSFSSFNNLVSVGLSFLLWNQWIALLTASWSKSSNLLKAFPYSVFFLEGDLWPLPSSDSSDILRTLLNDDFVASAVFRIKYALFSSGLLALK